MIDWPPTKAWQVLRSASEERLNLRVDQSQISSRGLNLSEFISNWGHFLGYSSIALSITSGGLSGPKTRTKGDKLKARALVTELTTKFLHNNTVVVAFVVVVVETHLHNTRIRTYHCFI